MTEGSEPILRLGPSDGAGGTDSKFEVDYATDTGNLILKHVDSGATFEYNESASQWEVGSLSTEETTITQTAGSVYLSTNQTVISSTIVKIQFDTVDVDEPNAFETANHQLSFNKTGRYIVSPVIRLVSDSGWSDGDRVNLYVYLNGSITRIVQYRKRDINATSKIFPPTTVKVSSGDTMHFAIFQDSGSSQELRKGSDRTFLTYSRVG